jgi:hypothetical protein
MTNQERAREILRVWANEGIAGMEKFIVSILDEAQKEERKKMWQSAKDWHTKTCGGCITKAESRRQALQEAEDIADDHNGCVDIKCLSESNCGATIAIQIRALADGEKK